jgi:hypothetical protein
MFGYITLTLGQYGYCEDSSRLFVSNVLFLLGMATSTRLTGYSIKHPIIEYQNQYSVTRKTFFYENNDKIFRTINN